MKRSIHLFLLLTLLILIVIEVPLNASAHGTAYRLLREAPLAALEFHYSDGEPMAYAEVLVFSPQDRQVEHQNGRTDRHGKFAFCPDTPGAWLITANDGMGHLCEATAEVSPETLAGKGDKPHGQTDVGTPFPGSETFKIIAGVSLIFNLAFAVQLFRQHSSLAKRRS